MIAGPPQDREPITLIKSTVHSTVVTLPSIDATILQASHLAIGSVRLTRSTILLTASYRLHHTPPLVLLVFSCRNPLFDSPAKGSRHLHLVSTPNPQTFLCLPTSPFLDQDEQNQQRNFHPLLRASLRPLCHKIPRLPLPIHLHRGHRRTRSFLASSKEAARDPRANGNIHKQRR